MARKCKIAKNHQRRELVEKYAARRAELRKVISSPEASYEEKMEAQAKMSKLPRDSNKVRLSNICVVTGRRNGNSRKTGLSRHEFRRLVMKGMIPGVTKSSW